MATTTLDLYRAGISTGPCMDDVRQADADIFQQNGTQWVSADRSTGISTLAVKKGLRGTWWVLPRGATFDDKLLLMNDHGRHWAWKPSADMELAEYVRLLAALNPSFRRA